MSGKLYLIPTPLGISDIQDVIPAGVLKIIHSLDHFIVENLRTSRRFLINSGYPKKIDEIEFLVINKHSMKDRFGEFLNPCLEGIDVGLMSEAGVPAIADPGADIVEHAHKSGIQVIPLTGPSSILLALMGSGFTGQSFSFRGYLPVKKTELIQKIREIEARSVKEKQTQVFIETPYRNMRLFETLRTTCKPSTYLCIAVNLTTPEEQIMVKKISQWKIHDPDIDHKPAVFLIIGETGLDVKKVNFVHKRGIRPD